MSIQITLYRNQSEQIAVTKTLTEIATYTGVLRQGVSIKTPVVQFQGDFPVNCNYFYIPAFQRYYYVTDIASLRNSYYEISGRVDVLMSFRDAIRAQTAVIERQEKKWNLYLEDNRFRIYQNSMIGTMKFPYGFAHEQYLLSMRG